MDANSSGEGVMSATGFVPPFKVHLCWFEGGTSNARCAAVARELYELLHRPIHDDPVLRPGLEIPIEYGRELGGLLDALDAGTEPAAGVRMVIAILDAAAYAQPRVRELVARRALARWTPARTDEVLLPIVLDGRWSRQLEPLGALAAFWAIAANDEPDPDAARRWRLGSQVAVVAGRALGRRPLHGARSPRPQILLSHARDDLAALVGPLIAQIQTGAAGERSFELAERRAGEDFARRLDDARGDAVVLVVRTDRYFEAPACKAELAAAKRAGVPIVTLLATRDGELWTSEHSGNHRTLQWAPGREWELVTRCVQAWLSQLHFRAHAAAALARAGLPADSDVVSHRPELLDVVGAARRPGRRLLVHPDPPLSEREAAELRQAVPAVRLATPTTLLGRVLLAHDPEPPLAGTTIALSLSVAEDLPLVEDGLLGAGRTQQQLDDVIHAIVVATLSSGARIAYGGDFRKARGYAKKLSDLLRSWAKLGGGSSQLVCYVDPAEGSAGRAGDAGDDIDYEPVEVPPPLGADQLAGLRPVLWDMAMRDRMAGDCGARILLGGKARPRAEPDDGGYSGAWPGLLEEAWRTARIGRALYVIGGFGGAAAMIARMLETGEPDELIAASRAGPLIAQLTRDLDAARAALVARGASASALAAEGALHGIADLARALCERWRAFVAGEAGAWNNGLSVAENRRLFRSTDRTEITHLVFEGLRRLPRPVKHEPISWALYHGDIATVPEIDGYAVTASPGVPAVGAMAALDARMNGQLSSLAWPAGGDVALAQVTGGELTGRQVLVARLALPPAGQTLTAASVHQLARAVAQRADDVGFTSIACAAFGATLGLSVADAAQAMRAGFTEAGGAAKTVVLCETDRVRYEQLRAVFGGAATELRAGAPAAVTARDIVLLLQATVPTSPQPYGRIDATLVAPGDSDPVAPYANGRLTWPFWLEIRDRYVDFDKTMRMGRLLWKTFLTEPMRARIAAEAERRLVVLTDPGAAGLPWEIMIGDDGAPIALSSSVVRRVALAGGSTPPDRHIARGARLRVLLVVHPAGLRSAAIEADAVAAALRGRADVEVTRVDRPDVPTVIAALAAGYYDVLHYAGHAQFDDANPQRSGLVLDGGVLSGDQLPSGAAPRLVFLSACESGRLRRDAGVPAAPTSNGQPLAEAFLRRGVAALIGTFLAVDDRAACSFATTVHAQLAAGRALGVAVRAARKALYELRSPDWGNFMVFGDDQLVL